MQTDRLLIVFAKWFMFESRKVPIGFIIKLQAAVVFKATPTRLI